MKAGVWVGRVPVYGYGYGYGYDFTCSYDGTTTPSSILHHRDILLSLSVSLSLSLGIVCSRKVLLS
jgi:hypothetical protein